MDDNNVDQQYRKPVICIFLTIITLAIFWKVQNYEFINFDDPLYISENPHVQSPLNLRSVRWSFSLFQTGPNWIPLSWLSHMVDYQLYGLNPRGHHFNNLLFHLANTLLLFIALNRMTKAVWRSALVAALFAVHPLHVESVAWVSERKDVLSTFFWMLTIWAYARYVEKPGIRKYLLALLFFVLGMMSKPMLVTLPFVLLLLDYWPLGRLGTSDTAKPRISTFLHLVREKIPFFFFSASLSVVTFLAQQNTSAVRSLNEFPLPERIANALVAYVSYIGKIIWPHNLAVFYPYPGMAAWWQVAGSFLLLAGITFTAFRTLGSLPWVTVGWLWYVGTLFPVIGFVQVGLQSMADRYTYVPIIGLFIIVSWGMHQSLQIFSFQKVAFRIFGGILLVIFSVCTWFQTEYWRNDISLFSHALKVTSNNHLAHNNLALALSREGKLKEATLHFSEAIRIRPQSLEYR